MKNPAVKSLICVLILLLSCSPYKKYVRISPDFGKIRENIDTVAVFSDALVAITGFDQRKNFYSVNASRTLDSLILLGVSRSLSKKGYNAKAIEPCLMGSFMDTISTVPLKPLNDHLTQVRQKCLENSDSV